MWTLEKIGDAAVENLGVWVCWWWEIPVSLSNSFQTWRTGKSRDLGLKKKVANDFDGPFSSAYVEMEKLRFVDEQSDVLNIFYVAEERNGLGLKPINWPSQQLFPRLF